MPHVGQCRLCGSTTPDPPVSEGGEEFCCQGCSAVYRFFGPGAARDDAVASLDEPIGVVEAAETYLRIEGMHCPSCERLISRVAARVDGILAVASNYATATAKVTYNPQKISETDLPTALSASGYHARLRGEPPANSDDTAAFLRMVIGVALAGAVMMLYLAFFYPVNLGLVDIAEFEPVAWLAYSVVPGAVLILTTILIFYVGLPIMQGAWIGMRAGAFNMDSLLSIAILSAFLYSVGQHMMASLDLYFDVSAVIVAVVTVGRYLEQGAKAEATAAFTRLFEAVRPCARTWRGGELVELDASALRPGDRVVVRAGELIPADGRVGEGSGAVDEALLTGEAFPVFKAKGDALLGGTRLVEGECELRIGDTVSNRVEDLANILWDVQSSAAGVLGIADRAAAFFIPFVIGLAVAVTLWGLGSGDSLSLALLTGLATLVVSCPCTFGLAVPLTTAHAVSSALRQRIVFTSPKAFTEPGPFDIVAIDKTGTLTTGHMEVVRVAGSPQMVAYAAAVERASNHPIARAIARLDGSLGADSSSLHPGRGAEGVVDGLRVVAGSRSLFGILGWAVPLALLNEVAADLPDDAAVSFVGWHGRARGAIVTRDRKRADYLEFVGQLRAGRRLVLLTGAESAGEFADCVDEVHAGVPPEAKAAVIRYLRREGRVLMIGDGSNDAPALAAADFGIACGAVTTLAAEAADAVIPGDRVERVFTILELMRQTRRRVKQNMGWALLYNAIAIPLAASGTLNPLFAALAMVTSSALVVWNSSRPLASDDAEAEQRLA